MMKHTKTIHVLTIACAISMAVFPAIAHAKKLSFYHYYYVYPDSMTWCGKLVNEVFRNTNRNWRFTKKNVKKTKASFSVGDVWGVCVV